MAVMGSCETVIIHKRYLKYEIKKSLPNQSITNLTEHLPPLLSSADFGADCVTLFMYLSKSSVKAKSCLLWFGEQKMFV